MANIHTFEEHKYRHFNKALGCMIYSKEHYDREMKRRGLVPLDKAEAMAEEFDRKHRRKEYDGLSLTATEIIKSLKLKANKGHIRIEPGSRAFLALKELGVCFDKDIPEGVVHGGFN